MDLVHAVCAGLDVHKETVVACVRRVVNGTVRQEVRTFRTENGQLLARTDRRTDERVPPVAMASTGVSWKPIRNRFEGVFELHLCNAEHVKAVPGRKTDVKDSKLLAHGLLKPSVVGASGRDMLRAIVSGERAPVVLADLAGAAAAAGEDPVVVGGTARRDRGPPPVPARNAAGAGGVRRGADRQADGADGGGAAAPFCGGGGPAADDTRK